MLVQPPPGLILVALCMPCYELEMLSATWRATISQYVRSAFSVARFRRRVAVFCAFAFLTVGLAHAFTEHDGLGAGSQTVVSNISSEQPTGAMGHAIACDHCYGCTGVVAPRACVVTVIGRVETDLITVPAVILHSHTPGFQKPPPKFLT